MNDTHFGEIQEWELVGIHVMVGEVEQEGIVAGEVVAAEEDVKGDENFMCMVLDEDVLDEDFEGRLEGGANWKLMCNCASWNYLTDIWFVHDIHKIEQ